MDCSRQVGKVTGLALTEDTIMPQYWWHEMTDLMWDLDDSLRMVYFLQPAILNIDRCVAEILDEIIYKVITVCTKQHEQGPQSWSKTTMEKTP